MVRRRLALVAGIAASGLVLAACGSTVPLSDRGLSAQGGQSGLAGAGGLGNLPGSQAGGGGGAAGTTSAGTGSAGGDVTSAGAGGSSGPSELGAASGTGAASGPGASSAGGQVPGQTVPGVTATTVAIGDLVVNSQEADAYLASFGGTSLTVGDLHLEQGAVVSYINSHGGVAHGRHIVVVEHTINVANSSATEAQATCATWTQDNHVFAGVAPGAQVENTDLLACLAAHHTILVQSSFDPGDAQLFAQYPDYYYAPGSLESVQMARDYVQGLINENYFAGGLRRIGVLYYSAPSLVSAFQNGLLPALAAHGLKPSQSIEISYATDNSQDASTVAAIQSAELHFRAAGIDHVLFLDAGAGLAFFFMKQANSQNYYPKYGLETGSNPQYLEQNFSSSQLAGSVGIGWQPANDVDLDHFPPSPARSLCLQIMKNAGQQSTSANDEVIQLEICADFFFLQAALNRATSLTPEGFAAAVDSLTSAPTAAAASIKEGFGPGQHWGALDYEQLYYNTGCSCFLYEGGAIGAASS
ncbi:MAG: type 1 periplasmic-binding domain-containing protein [Mycobacteriales bacterium]